MRGYIIGIDPGQSGGIAIIDLTRRVNWSAT